MYTGQYRQEKPKVIWLQFLQAVQHVSYLSITRLWLCTLTPEKKLKRLVILVLILLSKLMFDTVHPSKRSMGRKISDVETNESYWII